MTESTEQTPNNDGKIPETTKKIRMAIKAKLDELDANFDDELPDYVVIMIANRKTRSEMAKSLRGFLGKTIADEFAKWLHRVLEILQSLSGGPDTINKFTPTIATAESFTSSARSDDKQKNERNDDNSSSSSSGKQQTKTLKKNSSDSTLQKEQENESGDGGMKESVTRRTVTENSETADAAADNQAQNNASKSGSESSRSDKQQQQQQIRADTSAANEPPRETCKPCDLLPSKSSNSKSDYLNTHQSDSAKSAAVSSVNDDAEQSSALPRDNTNRDSVSPLENLYFAAAAESTALELPNPTEVYGPVKPPPEQEQNQEQYVVVAPHQERRDVVNILAPKKSSVVQQHNGHRDVVNVLLKTPLGVVHHRDPLSKSIQPTVHVAAAAMGTNKPSMHGCVPSTSKDYYYFDNFDKWHDETTEGDTVEAGEKRYGRHRSRSRSSRGLRRNDEKSIISSSSTAISKQQKVAPHERMIHSALKSPKKPESRRRDEKNDDKKTEAASSGSSSSSSNDGKKPSSERRSFSQHHREHRKTTSSRSKTPPPSAVSVKRGSDPSSWQHPMTRTQRLIAESARIRGAPIINGETTVDERDKAYANPFGRFEPSVEAAPPQPDPLGVHPTSVKLGRFYFGSYLGCSNAHDARPAPQSQTTTTTTRKRAASPPSTPPFTTVRNQLSPPRKRSKERVNGDNGHPESTSGESSRDYRDRNCFGEDRHSRKDFIGPPLTGANSTLCVPSRIPIALTSPTAAAAANNAAVHSKTPDNDTTADDRGINKREAAKQRTSPSSTISKSARPTASATPDSNSNNSSSAMIRSTVNKLVSNNISSSNNCSSTAEAAAELPPKKPGLKSSVVSVKTTTTTTVKTTTSPSFSGGNQSPPSAHLQDVEKSKKKSRNDSKKDRKKKKSSSSSSSATAKSKTKSKKTKKKKKDSEAVKETKNADASADSPDAAAAADVEEREIVSRREKKRKSADNKRIITIVTSTSTTAQQDDNEKEHLDPRLLPPPSAIKRQITISSSKKAPVPPGSSLNTNASRATITTLHTPYHAEEEEKQLLVDRKLNNTTRKAAINHRLGRKLVAKALGAELGRRLGKKVLVQQPQIVISEEDSSNPKQEMKSLESATVADRNLTITADAVNCGEFADEPFSSQQQPSHKKFGNAATADSSLPADSDSGSKVVDENFNDEKKQPPTFVIISEPLIVGASGDATSGAGEEQIGDTGPPPKISVNFTTGGFFGGSGDSGGSGVNFEFLKRLEGKALKFADEIDEETAKSHPSASLRNNLPLKSSTAGSSFKHDFEATEGDHQTATKTKVNKNETDFDTTVGMFEPGTTDLTKMKFDLSNHLPPITIKTISEKPIIPKDDQQRQQQQIVAEEQGGLGFDISDELVLGTLFSTGGKTAKPDEGNPVQSDTAKHDSYAGPNDVKIDPQDLPDQQQQQQLQPRFKVTFAGVDGMEEGVEERAHFVVHEQEIHAAFQDEMMEFDYNEAGGFEGDVSEMEEVDERKDDPGAFEEEEGTDNPDEGKPFDTGSTATPLASQIHEPLAEAFVVVDNLKLAMNKNPPVRTENFPFRTENPPVGTDATFPDDENSATDRKSNDIVDNEPTAAPEDDNHNSFSLDLGKEELGEEFQDGRGEKEGNELARSSESGNSRLVDDLSTENCCTRVDKNNKSNSGEPALLSSATKPKKKVMRVAPFRPNNPPPKDDNNLPGAQTTLTLSLASSELSDTRTSLSGGSSHQKESQKQQQQQQQQQANSSLSCLEKFSCPEKSAAAAVPIIYDTKIDDGFDGKKPVKKKRKKKSSSSSHHRQTSSSKKTSLDRDKSSSSKKRADDKTKRKHRSRSKESVSSHGGKDSTIKEDSTIADSTANKRNKRKRSPAAASAEQVEEENGDERDSIASKVAKKSSSESESFSNKRRKKSNPEAPEDSAKQPSSSVKEKSKQPKRSSKTDEESLKSSKHSSTRSPKRSSTETPKKRRHTSSSKSSKKSTVAKKRSSKSGKKRRRSSSLSSDHGENGSENDDSTVVSNNREKQQQDDINFKAADTTSDKTTTTRSSDVNNQCALQAVDDILGVTSSSSSAAVLLPNVDPIYSSTLEQVSGNMRDRILERMKRKLKEEEEGDGMENHTKAAAVENNKDKQRLSSILAVESEATEMTPSSTSTTTTGIDDLSILSSITSASCGGTVAGGYGGAVAAAAATKEMKITIVQKVNPAKTVAAAATAAKMVAKKKTIVKPAAAQTAASMAEMTKQPTTATSSSQQQQPKQQRHQKLMKEMGNNELNGRINAVMALQQPTERRTSQPDQLMKECELTTEILSRLPKQPQLAIDLNDDSSSSDEEYDEDDMNNEENDGISRKKTFPTADQLKSKDEEEANQTICSAGTACSDPKCRRVHNQPPPYIQKPSSSGSGNAANTPSSRLSRDFVVANRIMAPADSHMSNTNTHQNGPMPVVSKTPCSTFPRCRFGDRCKFAHPLCKFDLRCTRVNCSYSHSKKLNNAHHAQHGGNIHHHIGGNNNGMGMGMGNLNGINNGGTSTLANLPYFVGLPIRCKSGRDCLTSGCPFIHPTPPPCLYGTNCTRRNCTFSHPNLDVSTAVTSHLTDNNAPPLPFVQMTKRRQRPD